MARKFTPSQQLRGALFVLYCEQPREEDFESFYKDQITKAINRVHKVLERRGAMQLKIDSVTDVKSNDKGTSSKIICGGVGYFVPEDATQHIGKTVEATVEEKTSAAGRKYNTAKIVKVLGQAASADGGGAKKWEDFKQLAELAHSTALGLEPDTVVVSEDGTTSHTTIDRSQARIAFVQTVLVAFRDGKLYLPDDEIPF